MASISPPYGACTSSLINTYRPSDMRRAFFCLGSPPSDAYSLGSMEAGGGTVYAYLHRGEIAEWREIANFQEIFRKMLGLLAPDRLFSIDMASSGHRALHATWLLCNSPWRL